MIKKYAGIATPRAIIAKEFHVQKTERDSDSRPFFIIRDSKSKMLLVRIMSWPGIHSNFGAKYLEAEYSLDGWDIYNENLYNFMLSDEDMEVINNHGVELIKGLSSSKNADLEPDFGMLKRKSSPDWVKDIICSGRVWLNSGFVSIWKSTFSSEEAKVLLDTLMKYPVNAYRRFDGDINPYMGVINRERLKEGKHWKFLYGKIDPQNSKNSFVYLIPLQEYVWGNYNKAEDLPMAYEKELKVSNKPALPWHKTEFGKLALPFESVKDKYKKLNRNIMNRVSKDRVLLEGLVRKYGKKDVLNYIRLNEMRISNDIKDPYKELPIEQRLELIEKNLELLRNGLAKKMESIKQESYNTDKITRIEHGYAALDNISELTDINYDNPFVIKNNAVVNIKSGEISTLIRSIFKNMSKCITMDSLDTFRRQMLGKLNTVKNLYGLVKPIYPDYTAGDFEDLIMPDTGKRDYGRRIDQRKVKGRNNLTKDIYPGALS